MAVIVSAELGINHQGDPNIATRMIRAAKKAGCDAVKIQSYTRKDIPDDSPYLDVLEPAQIWQHMRMLSEVASSEGLLFGVTPSSIEGVQQAVDAGADFLKNASENLRRLDLIQAMLDTGLPTWVSTGMGTEKEILAVPHKAKLMLCTSLYPCPDWSANLARLWNPWMYFQGFSDHTQGTLAAAVAAALGVEMVEKHFTLDTTMSGPDHWFSADPVEMRWLVDDVRRVETLMGSSEVGFAPGEAEMRAAILA